ncbi:tRNA threonylcarbamoyladenosine dehydratase [Hylemonella gracilis]|nr:tRNA threonylcarbamoyladenosine dehydratase [Hylemonella gracilis]
MMQAADIEPPDLERRFGGLARLYGQAGAARIRAAHVVVVGVGGVGSWAVEGLARSGVGRLTLIDMDHVAESNINRQIHALDGTLGQAKVQAMRERIAQINPACEVRCLEEFVEPANWPGLIAHGPTADAVIDACDQVHAKTALAAWARDHMATPYITVGAAGGKTQAHLVAVDDLAIVTHDPLLAQLRYRLRKQHGAPRAPEHARGANKAPRKMGVSCVYSKEAVRGPRQDDETCAVGGDGSLNCSGYGSLVSVTATFGLCAAGWVLNNLATAGAA